VATLIVVEADMDILRGVVDRMKQGVCDLVRSRRFSDGELRDRNPTTGDDERNRRQPAGSRETLKICFMHLRMEATLWVFGLSVET
jgi:hypothetical protein